MEKIKIPLYRATKIDSDEIVIGDYCNGFIIVSVLVDTDLRIFKIQEGYQIDPTTLGISFDDGKSFIRLSDLEFHTCTDFVLTYSDMKMRTKKETQPANGSIFTVITDKGR